MTSRTATRRTRNERARLLATARKAQVRRERRRQIVLWTVVIAVLGGIVTAMMVTSRATSSGRSRVAPDFTLTDTARKQVHLADYRGRNVVLYFSEGAGCGSCLQQMAAIENDKAAFDKAGITVLPIVMNTRDQIMKDMATYGVKTPFLLDDGHVSRAYKTIGRGMHAGLPGHSFVLIDNTGTQRWYGEYPSMYLSTQDLLKQVKEHLAA